MPKPFPLQMLLDLAHWRSDAAALDLGVLNHKLREMDVRLQLLLDYRDEYQARLARAIQAGLESASWRNYRAFLDKLEAAIAQQRELLECSRLHAETGRHHWHSEQRRLKSFDTLSRRHRQSEARREQRGEQRELDDLAVKGFLMRGMPAG